MAGVLIRDKVTASIGQRNVKQTLWRDSVCCKIARDALKMDQT